MSDQFCVTHIENTAVGYCYQCHKPYCGDCAVNALGQTFCSKDCSARFADFQKKYKAGKRAPLILKLLKRLLMLAVIAGLGYFAYRFLTTDPRGRELVEKVRGQAAGTKE